MAIKNAAGDKVSAKELVEDLFGDAVTILVQNIGSHPQVVGLTDREKGLVVAQATKIGTRLLKKLRFDVDQPSEAVEA